VGSATRAKSDIVDEEQQLDARFLIRNRDSKFSAGFRRFFKNAGIRCLRTPLLAPDANTSREAWIGVLKREALDYFLCFSLAHPNHIGQSYVRFFNEHGPHQGLGNRTVPVAATGPPNELSSYQTPEIGRRGPARDSA
jgi:putative transposase